MHGSRGPVTRHECEILLIQLIEQPESQRIPVGGKLSLQDEHWPSRGIMREQVKAVRKCAGMS